MSHPIPSAALDDRLGFLGTSGSGKTYNAGVAVERLLSKKARVVIVDPLGVWWGLRLTADGKHASPHNVVIFGGPRGDLPLTEHAGALIGETAATMAESCIIDLRELGSKSAERRFMTAFLDTLYRKASGEPFHLVVDEADLFAPQKPAGGDETLLGHMENIVRRGRVKGFIPWLISQRPAVLNKNVLSQVDGLIAFKLTSSQDRDALDSWIEGQADKAQGKAIKDALPAMEVGQGVVWLPGRSVLATAKFPPKATFDSSRTPKRGEKAKRTAALKPLDLGSLKGQLAAVEAEAKANDPKKLRAEIAALKAERAKLEKAVADAAGKKPVAAKDAIEAAEKRGFEQAKKAAVRAAKKLLEDGVHAIETDIAPLDAALRKAIADFRIATGDRLRDLVRERQALQPQYTPATAPTAMAREPAVKLFPELRAGDKIKISVVQGDGAFTGPQLKVMRSLAMWRALGHDTPSREMVAAVAGYSPSSGGFNNLLGQLGTMGAVGKPAPGRVSLLADGVEVMDINRGRNLLLSTLSNPKRKIISTLIDRGTLSREEVALNSGYSASSGGFNNLIGSLSTLGIIVKPEQGKVSLSDWAQGLLSGCALAA